MTPRRSVRAGVLAVVLAGACLLGADFGRPDPASFVLGKTTESEIHQRFGRPNRRSPTQVGERLVVTVRYTHVEARSTVIATVPGRRADLYSYARSERISPTWTSKPLKLAPNAMHLSPGGLS
jgi:hypothetical protein